jgi:hypothetical protein
MSRLRTRLDRLERAAGGSDLSDSAPTLLELARHTLAPESCTAGDRDRIESFLRAHPAKAPRAPKSSPAARLYREELARRGLPQPESLVGIEPFDELMRLDPVPSPRPDATVG